MGEIRKLQRSNVNQHFPEQFLTHPRRLLHSFSIIRRERESEKRLDAYRKEADFDLIFKNFMSFNNKRTERECHIHKRPPTKKGMNSEG